MKKSKVFSQDNFLQDSKCESQLAVGMRTWHMFAMYRQAADMCRHSIAKERDCHVYETAREVTVIAAWVLHSAACAVPTETIQDHVNIIKKRWEIQNEI
jgi:hypothetical protein